MNSNRDSKPGQRTVCSMAQCFPSAGQGVPWPHRGPGQDAAFAITHCLGKHTGKLREGISLSSGVHHFWSFLSFAFSSLPASTASLRLIKHIRVPRSLVGLSHECFHTQVVCLSWHLLAVSFLPSHSSVAHKEVAVNFKQQRLGCRLVLFRACCC